mgnify:CR=1 FL=1
MKNLLTLIIVSYALACNAESNTLVSELVSSASKNGWRLVWTLDVDSYIKKSITNKDKKDDYPQAAKKAIAEFNSMSQHQAIVLVCRNKTILVTEEPNRYNECHVLKNSMD